MAISGLATQIRCGQGDTLKDRKLIDFLYDFERPSDGAFRGVVDMQTAINLFLAEHDERVAKPFVWQAEPDAIKSARNDVFEALEQTC